MLTALSPFVSPIEMDSSDLNDAHYAIVAGPHLSDPAECDIDFPVGMPVDSNPIPDELVGGNGQGDFVILPPFRPKAQAVVVTPDVYDGWADERYPHATGAEELVVAFGPGTILEEMDYQILGADGAVALGTLSVDIDMDGYPDFELASDSGIDGELNFDLGWGYAIPEGSLSLTVEIEFADGAEAGIYQLSEPDVQMSHWGHGVNVINTGYANPEITYEVLADMRISIDGPASQTFQAGDNDVVLADVNIDVSEAVTMYTSILVEGNQSLEDLVMRDTATGQTVELEADSYGTFAGAQVYTTSYIDMRSEGLHTWQVIGDVVDTAEPGNTFEVSVLNDADVEGRWFGTYAYQMDGGGGVQITPEGRISGNRHSVGDPPRFNVVQIATGTTDVAVENQHVTLMRYEGLANGADLLMTELVVQADAGEFVNVTDLAWWMDTDGDFVVDTILEDGVGATESGGWWTAQFADPAGGGYVYPDGQVIVSEVHAKASSSLMPDNTLQVGLGTILIDDFIRVEMLDDGSTLNSNGINTNGAGPEDAQIIVTTTDSIVWTFESQGDLYVTTDTTPVNNPYLLASTLEEGVQRVQLESSGTEPIDVTDLRWSVVAGEGISIDRLQVYEAGEATPIGYATRGAAAMSGTDADFALDTESRQVVVEDRKDLIVWPQMHGDVEGAMSVEQIQLALHSVEARGDVSSNNLVQNDGDATAEGEILIGVSTPGPNQPVSGVESEVVFAAPSGATNVHDSPSGSQIFVGSDDVHMAKISASSHDNTKNGSNDLLMRTFVYYVNMINVEASTDGFALYNAGDSLNTMSPTSITYADGTAVTTPTVNQSVRLVFEGVNDHIMAEIDQGADETFGLRMNVTNPNTSTVGQVSSLRASLSLIDSVFGDEENDFLGFGLPETDLYGPFLMS